LLGFPTASNSLSKYFVPTSLYIFDLASISKFGYWTRICIMKSPNKILCFCVLGRLLLVISLET
jgi:hypothetical protein